jgi:hypothetical protein
MSSLRAVLDWLKGVWAAVKAAAARVKAWFD